MDDDLTGEDPDAVEMRPLDPRELKVIRIRVALTFLFLMIPALALDRLALEAAETPPFLLPGLVALLAIPAIILLPGRRYRAWAYAERDDELHLRHGLWTRVQTAVPFGRVQHIDVAQGPIERRFDLARLILHTAGTRSAAIPLPGLVHSEAEQMRDRIRARIKQDLS